MSLDLLGLLNLATSMSLLIFVFYMWSKNKQTYWAKRCVHSPPGAHWLLGHHRDVVLGKATSARVLAELYSDPSNGDQPVVGVYNMQHPYLLLRSPSVIERVLVRDSECFSDRNLPVGRESDAIGTANLLAMKNPNWRYLRSKLEAAFGSGEQKALFSLMLESAENMRRFLEDKLPASGKKANVDVRDVSARYTVDVMSSFSFGTRTNSFQRPRPEFYTRIRRIFKKGLYSFLLMFIDLPFPNIIDFFGVSVLNNPDYYRKIFWESIDERVKSGAKRGDAIDFLLNLKKEPQNGPFKFEGDYLVAQSIGFFAAGQETSSIAIDFSLLELARHPEIQEKVRDELRENIGDEGVTYESVAKMTYLNQVISETLRLYPPTPLLDRVANENYTIPGTHIVIEKGTVVYIALNGLHEDPALHPDPKKFDPDRFSEKRKKKIKSCTYMPFGAGPRICIGSRIGSMQTAVALITILRNYKVSLNPKFQEKVRMSSVFATPDNGINLYFSKSPV